eukprot:3408461-Rhodomonas_salina.2
MPSESRDPASGGSSATFSQPDAPVLSTCSHARCYATSTSRPPSAPAAHTLRPGMSVSGIAWHACSQRTMRDLSTAIGTLSVSPGHCILNVDDEWGGATRRSASSQAACFVSKTPGSNIIDVRTGQRRSNAVSESENADPKCPCSPDRSSRSTQQNQPLSTHAPSLLQPP